MKKIFAIFFLFIFLFNTMGYLIVFQLEQYSIKKEMTDNIRLGVFDDRVSVITIDNVLLTSANPVFEIKGNEFTYKGKQFDILRKVVQNNKTTFYAVNDIKEEHLMSSLEDHVQNTTDLAQTHKHPLSSKNFGKSLSELYFFKTFSLQLNVSCNTVSYLSSYLIYSSTDKKAALLPPKIA